jgi:hypothetical protein
MNEWGPQTRRMDPRITNSNPEAAPEASRVETAIEPFVTSSCVRQHLELMNGWRISKNT